MKRIIYSSAAILCSIIGLWAVQPASSNGRFVSKTFIFLPSLCSAPTLHQLTVTSDWLTVTSTVPSCVGSDYVCVVKPVSSDNITTKAQLAAKIRASGKIPTTYIIVNQEFACFFRG